MSEYISRHAARYIKDPAYRPDRVLEEAVMTLPLKSAREWNCKPRTLVHLSIALKVDAPTLSNVKNKRIGFPPYLIIALMELTGWSLDEFKRLAGINVLRSW